MLFEGNQSRYGGRAGKSRSGWTVGISAIGFAGVVSLWGAFAQAQEFTTDAAAKQAAMVRKACMVENIKYCNGSSTDLRVNAGCLRQHHLNLRLSCRRALSPGVMGAGAGAAAPALAPPP